MFCATLDVHSPGVDDPIIARHGDPERLAWMHANFTDYSRVAGLGEPDSYATRLYDYTHAGRDQIRWVVDRLAANPRPRDATVTSFQPLSDTSYIPCVSLLDFWPVKGELQLAVYAHSIDFGTKGYANLVELAALQARVRLVQLALLIEMIAGCLRAGGPGLASRGPAGQRSVLISWPRRSLARSCSAAPYLW